MLCEGHLGRRCLEVEMKFYKEAWTAMWAVEVKEVGWIQGRVSRNMEKACWGTGYEGGTQ